MYNSDIETEFWNLDFRLWDIFVQQLCNRLKFKIQNLKLKHGNRKNNRRNNMGGSDSSGWRWNSEFFIAV